MKLNNIKTESTKNEFKEKLEEEKPAHWLKTLVAFANSGGDTLKSVFSGG